jgi:hypothetical protein
LARLWRVVHSESRHGSLRPNQVTRRCCGRRPRQSRANAASLARTGWLDLAHGRRRRPAAIPSVPKRDHGLSSRGVAARGDADLDAILPIRAPAGAQREPDRAGVARAVGRCGRKPSVPARRGRLWLATARLRRIVTRLGPSGAAAKPAESPRLVGVRRSAGDAAQAAIAPRPVVR